MKAEEKKRLVNVGQKHAAFVLGSLTLWGVSDYWAAESELILALGLALINSVVAGTIIASILHEWGHFLGARLSGSNSPLLEKTFSFFFFNFKDEGNTKSQFLQMSLGGPLANWSLVIGVFLLLPLETWSQILLIATMLSIAVSVSIFEVPIMLRLKDGEPSVIIQKRLEEAGSKPRNIGIAAGALGALFWILST
tara:strand:- start:387 stop:971 length:585 start_codon:yes stop_codon:yes gene_type:complete